VAPEAVATAPLPSAVTASPVAVRSWLWLVGVALLGAAALEVARGQTGFYEDEGVNLLKAFMVARGHSLYREVFSDQAPAFTWLLAGMMRVLGTRLAIYQQLALLCGVALLAAVAAVTAELVGRRGALLAAALLLLFLPFSKFATTVVITVPAAALATWSLFFGLRHRAAPGRRSALVVSGLLLGLAGTVKLAALYFVPVVATALLLAPSPAPGVRRRALVVWLVAVLAPLVLVAALIPLSFAVPQMFRPHLAAFGAFAEQTAAARSRLLLAPEMILLYAATLVSLVNLRRMEGCGVLAAWVAVVAVWIFNVRPLWTHHLPDLACPISACLAAATVAGLRGFRSAVNRRVRALWLLPLPLAAAGLVVHIGRYDRWQRLFANAAPAALQAVADVLARQTTGDDWVIVDRPMVAFLAGRRVPPALAMISQKRVQAALSDDDLTGAVDRYRPAMLVLCSGRFDGFERFQARVQADYLRTRRVIARDGAGHGSCLFFRRRG
jgi:4-amino-4-deoxy-L-arabinose transferase-like glycosyltransferase